MIKIEFLKNQLEQRIKDSFIRVEPVKGRPKERIKRILKKIEKVWEADNDLRLFQLLLNIVWLEQENTGGDLFNLEDKELEKYLDKRIKHNAKTL